eukprot:6213937-Pleurochrysis_carterae.AAC.8
MWPKGGAVAPNPAVQLRAAADRRRTATLVASTTAAAVRGKRHGSQWIRSWTVMHARLYVFAV